MDPAGTLRSSKWFLAMVTCLVTFYSQEDPSSPLNDGKVKLTKLSNIAKSYDFIIIGAGSAGSVVANRLSEIKNWKILLIEAGGEENEISNVPVLAFDLWQTRMDWNYSTVKQEKGCKDFNGNCYYPRGHVLGGTSSINFQIYSRGNPRDYDLWESLGATGWGRDEIYKYFKKSEDNVIDYLQNSEYHGKGGYLTVNTSSYYSPITDSFIEALKEMKYGEEDYNGRAHAGYSVPHLTIRNGSKCSTSKAFLSPLKDRSNIQIITNSLVNRIIINKESKRAVGVQFVSNGVTKVVSASKEIILSAGSINTPQLLMLSGIGPKEQLNELKIPLIADLPVGKNLIDRSYLVMVFKVAEENTIITKKDIENSDAVNLYGKQGRGVLTLPLAMPAIAFLDSKGNSTSDWPDTGIYLGTQSINNNSSSILLSVTNLRPESRGTIKLSGKSISDKPLIDPKYYSETQDYDRMVNGCILVLNITRSKFFSGSNPKIVSNCSKPQISDQDLCKCLVDTNSQSMYHTVGTAAMGQKPSNSVVTPNLMVRGIQALRVIDASVMPYIPSGDTNAPTIMVAEKGSDMIKDRWIKK